MVVDQLSSERADQVFSALGDPTRRDIVRRAMRGGHTVSSLAVSYPMSFAAVQKHVAVLEAASLVTKQARHRDRFVRGNHETIRSVARALDDLERVWMRRLERFEAELGDGRPGGDDH
jgi:DNA-binding transcriptional ArsR family regulator